MTMDHGRHTSNDAKRGTMSTVMVASNVPATNLAQARCPERRASSLSAGDYTEQDEE
jgi:hypothetical protein